ncbi:MAG: spermidine/putrescine ABC transporter ATP-binding protein [Candidatus Dactylopiibacterium carminicum]|uniref:Spermidine/putrescine import ATP-binding protein PotA n=1 Tax=Candidatus Dactylopiibacterium carminicum TaxID=857335 RepID=A0A272EPJ3_9RHOO|nr:ABC transporter ATP-binding protein [Candidatus Dactylopiibacterium carminicum]KAF7598328.1 ABC transporter ATP-binding protein [Candidatus Dactylopiibacterium carminicum]PAS92054.1 MAG: spermidine/putrescine ABC transporter ATP-binding protein [Candidatus Dactylopiibacterium carminicum]PAS95480.1 MAG: spermidine/putrescine ABC transporter ATP-binding protein [Candidatus Dactylopiibacterium carminicum]PAS97380.1 MAG: spermidine/putrescine ABC transporter ATP-binding protein [Candidatus Dacty
MNRTDPAGEAHVTFSGVRKTYDGEHLIVSDLNLAIRRGEFLTLLGPSGSGKTTCLMMLAGFETPTAGEIRLNGQVINRLPPHRRNIGMVFQNYALFPHMTVRENLRFPLAIRKLPAAEIDRKVTRALDMVQLGGLGERYPQQLSGGQQQRIALARALVFDPELVLMDEPLGALDKQLREHMQLEIKHLQQALGVTVVFVTHDQSEALTMSDRIAVFDQGVIQQIDDPATLYELPANNFVANFIGENNALEGAVESVEGDRCTVKLDGGLRVQASIGNPVATGARTVLSVRPESIQLNVQSLGCANRLGGYVREITYLGDHLRVQVELAGRKQIIVKAPAAQHKHRFDTGDAIHVGINPQQIRALAPSA